MNDSYKQGKLPKNRKIMFTSITHQTAISNPASCLEPTRKKVDPSSKVLSIISNHHCPMELPSRPTFKIRSGWV